MRQYDLPLVFLFILEDMAAKSPLGEPFLPVPIPGLVLPLPQCTFGSRTYGVCLVTLTKRPQWLNSWAVTWHDFGPWFQTMGCPDKILHSTHYSIYAIQVGVKSTALIEVDTSTVLMPTRQIESIY